LQPAAQAWQALQRRLTALSAHHLFVVLPQSDLFIHRHRPGAR
jgi:hypothetical protein